MKWAEFKHPGFLISLDGTDGAGKTTLTQKLKDWLKDHDYKVFCTEWNSSSWMEPAIDDAKERRVLTPLTLTLASATDLADRIERDIKPELEKGHVVICDRYVSSAIARGVVRGVNEAWIRDLFSTFLIKPNLGFYLYVSPKEARDRLLADKGRVGHHESGSDVLGREKGEPEDEDETNKRNFVRFMEKQIPIFNRLAKEFHLHIIDTLDKKKRKVRHEAEDILKEALDKHSTVLKKELEIETVPAGKLRIPGAQQKVLVYNDDTVTQEGDNPSPRFVPESEQVWYDKIHGLQGKTLFQLRQVWTKFKKDFLDTVEKDLEIEKAGILSGLVNRAIQIFENKAGYWITREGKRIFITSESLMSDKAVSLKVSSVFDSVLARLPNVVRSSVRQGILDSTASRAVGRFMEEVVGISSAGDNTDFYNRIAGISAAKLSGIAGEKGVELARNFSFEWTGGSSTSYSLYLKSVISRLYGGTVYKGSNIIEKAPLPDYKIFGVTRDHFVQFTDNYVKSQYALTQLVLKNRGVNSVTLYRGLMLPGKDIASLERNKTFITGALSSFSTDLEISQHAASRDISGLSGVILTTNIPREHVFGTWTTGFADQDEWVVLGGSKTKFQVLKIDKIIKADVVGEESGDVDLDQLIHNREWLRKIAEKIFNLDDDEIEKADTLTDEQKQSFQDMLGEFDNVAQAAFMNAVGLGNLYFEDQFQMSGINQKQQEQVADKHFNTFQTKASNLFQDDVISNLRENTIDKWFNVLNGFDKYLAGYANAVAAVAYDTFTKDIGLLNKGIGTAYQLAGRGKKDNLVKVVWVLDPEAHHSDDCWNMAELDNFGYGPGVWDADYLAQNDLVPRSPRLDCGGNCKCHLSAMVPLEAEDASWLDNMLKTPTQESVLDLIPNMSKPEFMKVMGQSEFDIPDQIRKLLSEQNFLRRAEFWKKLPAVSVETTARATFGVDGETLMNFGTKLPESIRLTIGLPEGTTLDTLTEVQRREIVNTMAHEVGHLVANDSAGFDAPTGIFGDKVAETFYKAAYQERLQALGQIQVNFENAVDQIAAGSMTKQIRRDIEVMKLFNEDPINFLDTLFTAVQNGKDFEGIDARKAWTIVNEVLAQYSPGTTITRTYQLWSTDEYFADWFALLLTDPDKAALFSPRLTKLASSLLPERFFDNVIRRRVANLLPEAIAATRRIDLPLPSRFDPIAPNVSDFDKAISGINSITKKVGTDIVAGDVLDVLKNNPQFQRTEFFDNLKINFADKVQIGKRVGSQRAFGFFDSDTSTFFVNYDKWKDLDNVQKANYLGDVVAQQILQTATPKVEKAIADRFTIYLDAVLRYLERKGALEGLRPDELKSVRETIIGIPPIEDETTGELSAGVPRNLAFWMRNFESTFKPILENITDLPVLNVDSLASPSTFFREWVRLYLTSPDVASVYPGFREIIQTYLGIQKSLEEDDLELAALASLAGKVMQYFRGAEGRWITSKIGKKIFIAETAAAAEAIAGAAKSESSFLSVVQSGGPFTPANSDLETAKWNVSAIVKEAGFDNLKELSGLKVDAEVLAKVEESVKSWFGVSAASALQDAAAAEFGLGSYTEYRGFKFDRAILRSVYNMTQRELASKNITYVTVHRGMQFLEEGTAPKEVKDMIDVGKKVGLVTFDSNPLSSFTTRRIYAQAFADMAMEGEYSQSAGVLTVTLPAGDVFSIPKTGFGDGTWSEVVILGRKKHTGTYRFN